MGDYDCAECGPGTYTRLTKRATEGGGWNDAQVVECTNCGEKWSV
jgi:uncharacterized Zn finger protein